MRRMHDRRKSDMTTMWRTRILIGLLSTAHGAGSLLFDYGAGVTALVARDRWGWMFGCALVAFGALMTVAAIAERFGVTERWCREFSASLLGAAWIAVFYHSFDGTPDTITLLAPIYMAACGWSWWVEANTARQRIVAQRTGAL